MTFDYAHLLPLVPEIAVLVLASGILLVDLWLKDQDKGVNHVLAVAGLLVGHIHQIAQLQQVIADRKVAVILNDLVAEQINAAPGALQAFIGANDTHIIPHEAAQLLPVVGHHHRLVGLLDPAGVPGWHIRRRWHPGQSRLDIRRRLGGEDQAFQKRVAGHAVGAVKPRIGDLSDGVEAGQIRAGHLVRDDATAGVMGGGNHGDGLAGDVDPQLPAASMDGGEVLHDKVRRPVRDIQVQALGAQTLHLVVDGPGDDVAGGQFGAFVEARHERLAIGQQQAPTLAAQGLGDEEGSSLGMVEAGRMELHELQVGHPAAGAPGHGDAVASGNVGIAGVEINLAGPASGDRHEAGEQGFHLAALAIQNVSAKAAIRLDIELAAADEVHGDVALEEVNIGAGPDPFLQGRLHRLAGGVGGVDDAAMGVAALAGQMVTARIDGLGVTGELHALVEEPADAGRAMFHHQFHPLRVAQAGAGLQGILDVGIHGVIGVEDRRDAALGVVGTALAQFTLGNHGDGDEFRQAQSQAEARCAAAEDENVETMGLTHDGCLEEADGGDSGAPLGPAHPGAKRCQSL